MFNVVSASRKVKEYEVRDEKLLHDSLHPLVNESFQQYQAEVDKLLRKVAELEAQVETLKLSNDELRRQLREREPGPNEPC